MNNKIVYTIAAIADAMKMNIFIARNGNMKCGFFYWGNKMENMN